MGGRMKTAEATTIDERVYTPSSIEEARENLPGKGRRIRITYPVEYLGTNGEKMGKNRARTRKAVVVQKEEAHFTVEMIPENRIGARGRYKLDFLYVDVVIGRVKVREVD
jgi:hypothetical protein